MQNRMQWCGMLINVALTNIWGKMLLLSWLFVHFRLKISYRGKTPWNYYTRHVKAPLDIQYRSLVSKQLTIQWRSYRWIAYMTTHIKVTMYVTIELIVLGEVVLCCTRSKRELKKNLVYNGIRSCLLDRRDTSIHFAMNLIYRKHLYVFVQLYTYLYPFTSSESTRVRKIW